MHREKVHGQFAVSVSRPLHILSMPKYSRDPWGAIKLSIRTCTVESGFRVRDGEEPVSSLGCQPESRAENWKLVLMNDETVHNLFIFVKAVPRGIYNKLDFYP